MIGSRKAVLRHNRLNRSRLTILVLLCSLACSSQPSLSRAWPAAIQSPPALSKTGFEIIEGVFHDGLGTYAEVSLANELIFLAHLKQTPFDVSPSKAKMLDAINRLPPSHPSRGVFHKEIANIEGATKRGAVEILNQVKPAGLTRVRHTARDYADAKAGDLRLELNGRADLPVFGEDR